MRIRNMYRINISITFGRTRSSVILYSFRIHFVISKSLLPEPLFFVKVKYLRLGRLLGKRSCIEGFFDMGFKTAISVKKKHVEGELFSFIRKHLLSNGNVDMPVFFAAACILNTCLIPMLVWLPINIPKAQMRQPTCKFLTLGNSESSRIADDM